MHVAVLGSSKSWYLKDLRRAAGEAHTLIPVSYSQLVASVAGGEFGARSGQIDLREVDAVLVRSMPPGTLEQVVFRMDLLAQLQTLGVVVVNPPKACEAAIDKYLTTAKLGMAGLLVPRTYVCQTADEAMEAFAALDEDAVVKPLFGGEGRGITRVTDLAIALRVFKTLEQLGSVIYMQEFVEHPGCDLRVMLVGERLFGMRRRNQLDWRTNISLGGQGEPAEVTPEQEAVARRAAEAVGAEIAGVDLLVGAQGREYVLEVNAVPGWQALSRVTGEDVAAAVLEFVEGRVTRNARESEL